MAGEEVVGGVVGFLRMDIGDFERDMLKALAMVKALDGQDIDIDVKTNSRSVEKDLAGVERAAMGVGREVGNMGESFKGLRDPKLLVGAVAAGMALLGPVTGAATAAVGGFVGVVGTGVLAYQGFNKEVAEGTVLGKALQSGLDGVKGAFSDLGAVAAHAMSGGVLDSLAQLRTQLPGLSGDVKTLGEHLGNALSISTKGLLTGLQNMMPLLQDGGKYAEMLAQKFADFTNSQDFKDFVDYSRRELPQVASSLADVTKGVVSLATSLSDQGDGIVQSVGAIGKAMEVLSVVSDVDKLNKGKASGFEAIAKRLAEWKYGSLQAADATKVQASALADLGVVQSSTATSLGTTDAALNAAREAQAKHTQAAADATLQMYQEGDAAGLLKQQLDKLNGKAINAASAQNAFDSALANSNKHVAANGKTIDRATTSIKGMSAAAVANRGELIRQVTAAEDVATAMRDNGASTDETRAKMVTMRDEIIKNAHEHHLNADAVKAFIDKIYKIPKKIAPTKLEVETKAGLAGISAFQAAIDALHGKKVTASVRYAYEGQRFTGAGRSTAGGSTFANGGVIGSFAKGGAIPGYASGTIVGPGTGTSDSILAAIQGTQEMIRVSNGEFISTAASQRRNRAALEAGNRGADLTVAGGGGGIDYERLALAVAAQMRHVVLRPVVSAGQFDSTMGARV